MNGRCLVLAEWGDDGGEVTMDSVVQPRGPACRIGHRGRQAEPDLLLWPDLKATAPRAFNLRRCRAN